MYGVMVTVLAMRVGTEADPTGHHDPRLGIEQLSSQLRCPVMPTLAPSQLIRRLGVRFDRPRGWTTSVVTPLTADTRSEM